MRCCPSAVVHVAEPESHSNEEPTKRDARPLSARGTASQSDLQCSSDGFPTTCGVLSPRLPRSAPRRPRRRCMVDVTLSIRLRSGGREGYITEGSNAL
eukprot:14367341-Alexandrium_andersonii.AAC.1